jgi:uncharacterized protein YndB with AHSA1/START domain
MTERSLSRSTTVAAAPSEVFAVLADPHRHPDFDGSGTVKGRISGPHRLSLGDRFGMRMRFGLPYVISNQVVELEEDRRIAWRHFGHHRWRYELEPVEGGTRVTETFDWSGARSPQLLELARIPAINARSIEKTLERLRTLVES